MGQGTRLAFKALKATAKAIDKAAKEREREKIKAQKEQQRALNAYVKSQEKQEAAKERERVRRQKEQKRVHERMVMQNKKDQLKKQKEDFKAALEYEKALYEERVLIRTKIRMDYID